MANAKKKEVVRKLFALEENSNNNNCLKKLFYCYRYTLSAYQTLIIANPFRQTTALVQNHLTKYYSLLKQMAY